MAEYGEWTVDTNEEDTAVVLEFSHMGEDGVEAFTTAMPPTAALDLAQAVRAKAQELSD